MEAYKTHAVNQIDVWDFGERGSCLTARRWGFTSGSQDPQRLLGGGRCCESTGKKAIASRLKYTIQGFVLLQEKCLGIHKPKKENKRINILL